MKALVPLAYYMASEMFAKGLQQRERIYEGLVPFRNIVWESGEIP